MPDSHADALNAALDNGERNSPAAKTAKADWITWTVKMPPEQAEAWDAQVAKLAAATGRRVRRGGPGTDNGVTRRDLVEALVELAGEDEVVWERLVDKIRLWQPRK